MNIANLKPGDVLRRADRNNARRYTLMGYGDGAARLGRIAILQCDDFAGLNGPEDIGLCVVPVSDLAREFERVTP